MTMLKVMAILKIMAVLAMLAAVCVSMPTPESLIETTSLTPETKRNETFNNFSSLSSTVCNDVDEIVSNDPCKPLCACKEGKIFCADILCTTDSLPIENCWKLPLNGKCCPSYLCSTGNATGDVHYPLPVLVVPTELNLASIPPSKAELLHRAHRPGPH